MPGRFDDLLGTLRNTFRIGDSSAGTKTLSFRSGGFSLDLKTPVGGITANREHFLPDRSGTYAFVSDLPDTQTAITPGDSVFFWDAEASPTTTGQNLFATVSGGSLSTVAVDAAQRVGVLQLSTGATATGRYHIGNSPNSIALGSGGLVYSADIKVQTLSNATQRYQLLFGLYNSNTTINQTNGVYFLYDEGGASTGSAASANWQIVTANNSVRTFTTTSVTVAANTWVNLRVEINDAATVANFYIDGALAGSFATNIPSGVAKVVGWGAGIYKSVGTTAATYQIDWVYNRRSFTSPRLVPDLNGRRIIFAPTTQALSAGSTITPSNPVVSVTLVANTTLIATTQIGAGSSGQEIIVHNSSSFILTMVTGNGIDLLGGGSLVLPPNAAAKFIYVGGIWRILSTGGRILPTWTNLSLQNSFVATAGFQVPQIAFSNGQVFLRGVCDRTGSGLASGTNVCSLPVGLRPTSRIISPQPSARAPGVDIDVTATGDVLVFFNTAPSWVYLSLDGMSFHVN